LGGDFNLIDNIKYIKTSKPSTGKKCLSKADKLLIDTLKSKNMINMIEEMASGSDEWELSPCTTVRDSWVDKWFCHTYGKVEL
jgi:hypothetical protein